MESGGKGEVEEGEEEEAVEVEVEGTEDVWWRTMLHSRQVRKVGGEAPAVSPAPAPPWQRRLARLRTNTNIAVSAPLVHPTPRVNT